MTEPEIVVNPAQDGAGSVPAACSAANIPEGHNGPGVAMATISKRSEASIIRHFLYPSETNKLILKL